MAVTRKPKPASRARAVKREQSRPVPRRPTPTGDTYQNFIAKVGFGTDNQASAGTYGFNPITRLRILLDWAYRGSWLVRACVDAIPEDMTREGIQFTQGIDEDEKSKIYTSLQSKWQFWEKIKEAKSWGRLYGGAGIYILIDGHKPEEPLRIETLTKNCLLKLIVLDRWMINPSLNQIVQDPHEDDAGLPEFYDVTADAPLAARSKIHHSRFIRFEGLNIPYYQRLSENFWTLSVLEPLYDRITAFDSTTAGAAQLVYKAHLRTYAIKDLRKIIAAGGKLLDALFEQVDMVRRFQTNEGLTLMDEQDRFEAHQYAFGGLAELILQFAQQVSGSEQIPLVRLFGQSPAGMNATGESDWTNYHSGIKRRQESELRTPVTKLLKIIFLNEGIKPADDWWFDFVPLDQLDHQQRAAVASQITSSIQQAFESGLVNRGTALSELKQSSTYTGIWTDISDKEIEDAMNEPPLNPQMGQGGGEGEGGGMGGFLPGPPSPPKANAGSEEKKPEQDFLPGIIHDDEGKQEKELEDFLPKRRGFLPGDDERFRFQGGVDIQGKSDWRRPKLIHSKDDDAA
jgi:hypothetical protein